MRNFGSIFAALIVAVTMAAFSFPAGAAGILAYPKNHVHEPGSFVAFTGVFDLESVIPGHEQYLFGSSVANSNNKGVRLYVKGTDLYFALDRGSSTAIAPLGKHLSPGPNVIGFSWDDLSKSINLCVATKVPGKRMFSIECSGSNWSVTEVPVGQSEHNMYIGADGVGDHPVMKRNSLTNAKLYFLKDVQGYSHVVNATTMNLDQLYDVVVATIREGVN